MTGSGAIVDARLAWLGRASARLDLIEIGEMTLDAALDVYFVSDLLDAIPTICPCYSAQCRHFDRVRLELQQEQFRRWRASPAPKRERNQPPRSAIDAFEYLRRVSPEKLSAWLDCHPEFRHWRGRP